MLLGCELFDKHEFHRLSENLKGTVAKAACLFRSERVKNGH